jgi:hypothetical protein
MTNSSGQKRFEEGGEKVDIHEGVIGAGENLEAGTRKPCSCSQYGFIGCCAAVVSSATHDSMTSSLKAGTGKTHRRVRAEATPVYRSDSSDKAALCLALAYRHREYNPANCYRKARARDLCTNDRMNNGSFFALDSYRYYMYPY